MKLQWYPISKDRRRVLLLLLLAAALTLSALSIVVNASRTPADEKDAAALHSTAAIAEAETRHELRLESLVYSIPSQSLFATELANFEPPILRDDGRFASESTWPEFDSSCATAVDKPDSTRAMEQQLDADFGVGAQARVPENVYFDELTQFFRRGDRYLQLTARAEAGSRPPRYTFELYSATDSMMRNDLIREPLPMHLSQRDVPEVARVLEALRIEDKNAIWGARLLHVQIPGARGAAAQEIRFLNGGVQQWVFGSSLCQLARDRRHALCRCLSPDSSIPIPQT